MGNILNHNRRLIDFDLTSEDYWDFHLSQEVGYGGGILNGLSEECLSAYIDFNDPNCIFWDDAISKGKYVWENAINNGDILDYIGCTGVDNGFITYQKDRITNKDFLDIFLHSKHSIEANNTKLHLRKIGGNNQIYDYSNDIVNIDDREVSKLNGGFYQGYFKVYDKEYQVLPHTLGSGWSLEVKLKKSNFVNENITINDTHPNNKGLFLYIGTRAENKWWDKFKVQEEFKSAMGKYSEDGISNEYVTENGVINSMYIQDDEPLEKEYFSQVYGDESYLGDTSDSTFISEDYVDDEYYKNGAQDENRYASNEYLSKDEEITGDETLLTSDGFDFAQPNIIKYETDNKFLLFNHSSDGFTTKTWEDGTKVTMYDIKKPDIGNYFLLFNRTDNGYTTKTIENLIEEENKKYNVLQDLYRNALGFQIKEDGSIGYKFLVKDCESEEEKYKIEEEFSKSGVVSDDEWHTVSIKILPIAQPLINNNVGMCNTTTTPSNEMVIYIYVDGKLKLKSKQLPMLNLKPLDDLSDKQQGVPYSLSLGGGTQGLCDTVNINFLKLPDTVLPLEKEFCGSFIGYIQHFRFYTCPLRFGEIQENYKFDYHY